MAELDLQKHNIRREVYLRDIKFHSIEEAKVGLCLEKFLGLELVQDKTFQWKIDKQHAVDFYLPDQNVALEWHPVIVSFETQKRNFNTFIRVAKILPKGIREEFFAAIVDEKRMDYYRRRRFWMDQSESQRVRQARLLVVVDEQDLFKQVIRAYAKDVNFAQFKSFFDNLKVTR